MRIDRQTGTHANTVTTLMLLLYEFIIKFDCTLQNSNILGAALFRHE